MKASADEIKRFEKILERKHVKKEKSDEINWVFKKMMCYIIDRHISNEKHISSEKKEIDNEQV